MSEFLKEVFVNARATTGMVAKPFSKHRTIKPRRVPKRPREEAQQSSTVFDSIPLQTRAWNLTGAE